MAIVIILIGTILFLGVLCGGLASLLLLEEKPDVQQPASLVPDPAYSKHVDLVREIASEMEAKSVPAFQSQPQGTPPTAESMMSEAAV